MPIYDLKCNKCNHTFESLVNINSPMPPCPACGANDVFVTITNKQPTIRQQYSRSPKQGWTRRPIADMVDIRQQIEDVTAGKIQREHGYGVNLKDIENQTITTGVDDATQESWPDFPENYDSNF